MRCKNCNNELNLNNLGYCYYCNLEKEADKNNTGQNNKAT